jgi:hypothetical protein
MLNKLKNINWTKSMFLVPILLVAGISISHVITWYDMANPYNWAIYLSVAIEVGAMTSLIAATKKIKGGVWFMFGLVTFIQMVGNIFYSYVEIDANSDLFKNWVELMSPIFELMGTDVGDIIPHKRWLALLEGGFLPLISLTALHFYIKYDDGTDTNTPNVITPIEPNDVGGLPMDSLIGDEVSNTPTPVTEMSNSDYNKIVSEEQLEKHHEEKDHLDDSTDIEVEPQELTEEIEEVITPIELFSTPFQETKLKEVSEEEVERQKHLKFRKRIVDENIEKPTLRRDKITQKIIK